MSGLNKGKWQVTVEHSDNNWMLYVDYVILFIDVGGSGPNMLKISGKVHLSIVLYC